MPLLQSCVKVPERIHKALESCDTAQICFNPTRHYTLSKRALHTNERITVKKQKRFGYKIDFDNKNDKNDLILPSSPPNNSMLQEMFIIQRHSLCCAQSCIREAVFTCRKDIKFTFDPHHAILNFHCFRALSNCLEESTKHYSRATLPRFVSVSHDTTLYLNAFFTLTNESP